MLADKRIKFLVETSHRLPHKLSISGIIYMAPHIYSFASTVNGMVSFSHSLY